MFGKYFGWQLGIYYHRDDFLHFCFVRCYARLHPRAVNCRKKKCGHSNQVRFISIVIIYFLRFILSYIMFLLFGFSDWKVLDYAWLNIEMRFISFSWGQRRRSSKLWFSCCLACMATQDWLVIYMPCMVFCQCSNGF